MPETINMTPPLTMSDWVYENYPSEIILNGEHSTRPDSIHAYFGFYSEKYDMEFKVHWDIYEMAQEAYDKYVQSLCHEEWLDWRRTRYK